MLASLISASKYLSIMIPSMILGVIGVNLVVSLGFVEKLSFIARPVVSLGHLRDECGLSFITAFGSPTAANSMLVELYNKGNIEKRELFIASLANSFPAIIMHWRAMLPILIPLLGMTGLAYFGILVVVGLVKTAFVLSVGRLMLPKRNHECMEVAPKVRPEFWPALIEGIRNSKNIIRRIVMITIPITAVTFVLIDLGAFEALASYLKGITKYLPIPTEGVTIIGAQFAGNVAAYTVASNLLTKGVLAGKDIVLILLVGNVLTGIVGLRYLIPYYVGIFGPKIGTQLMVISTALRQGLIIMAIVALFLMR